MAETDLKSSRRARRQRRRRIAKWVKWIVLGLVAAAIAASVVIALMPRPIEVDLASVEERAMRITVEEDGKTQAKNRYVLSAPLSGNMNRIRFKPGDHVEESASLLRIVPATPPLLDKRSRANLETRLIAAKAGLQLAGAEVSRASAAVEEAQRQADKIMKLASKGAVPREQVEVSKFALGMRKDELRAAQFSAKVRRQDEASARAALGLLDKGSKADEGLDIVAPVSGEVLRVLRKDQEGLVAAGTPLLEIADLSAMEIVADVLTADAVDIPAGAATRIVRWGGEGELLGHVSRVEPSAFTRVSALGVEEQRVMVIVEVDSPREEWMHLGDGYRVEVEITLWSGEKVRSIPASAVFRHEGRWAAYKVEEGVARLAQVEIGHRNDERVEIISGLELGDEVIVNPSDRIVEGVEVTRRPNGAAR